MAVPTLISDLSTTASSNSPAGSDSPVDTDNFLRAHAAFIAQLNANKADKAGPTFTGTVVLPSTTSIGNVSSTEIGYLDNVTSAIQTQLNAKAALASPTLTGTPAAPTAAVDTNTTQIATTAFVVGQGYAKLAGPTFTGTVTLPSTTSIGSVSNTEIGYVNGVTSAIQTQLDAKAPLASPTFTGTVTAAALTTTGNVILGDASTDTVTCAGPVQIKGSAKLSFTDTADLTYVYAPTSNTLAMATNNTERVRIDSSGNTIPTVTATPPALSTNLQMVFNLTSDANLRISVRGSDGTTRVANITLA